MRVKGRSALLDVLSNTQRRSLLYVLALWSCMSTAVIWLVLSGVGIGNPYVVALLSSVAAISERGRIELSSNLSVSISLVPTLFAAVLFGPLAALIVAAASFAAELRRPYLRWASYTASRSITACVTGAITLAISAAATNRVLAVALATVIGAFVSQSVDAFFAAVALRLRRQERIRTTLHALVPLALAAVPVYAPVVAFLAFAYQDVSAYTLPLFFVPTLAAQRLFVLYQDQRRLTDELVTANDALERANLSFASALVATLDARDRYTAGHSAAVAIYARDIAASMGLSAAKQQLAFVCGLVHDVGKVGLPPGLLEKPGSLTLDERLEMQRHAVIGERILANVETYTEIASIVRHHHERVDGEGYPDGLRGEQIPLIARIIAVADAYNAMTSDRPYRDAMPTEVARARLAEASASQFDSTVVAAFDAILATRDEPYRVAQFGWRIGHAGAAASQRETYNLVLASSGITG